VSWERERVYFRAVRYPLSKNAMFFKFSEFVGIFLRLRPPMTSFFDNLASPCSPSSPLFGFLGCAAAIVFANFGGAYGTALAGTGIMAMGVSTPHLLMKNIIPVVMAGVLGIYGLIVAVIINSRITPPDPNSATITYSTFAGFAHLAAGLCVGLSSLASGLVSDK